MNTLIIICYNEKENIIKLIPKIKLVSKKINGEILIVDNGSSDNSFRILKNLEKKIKNLSLLKLKKNYGYGGGIFKGIKKSKFDIVCWTHGDGQYNLEDCVTGFNKFKKIRDKKNYALKAVRLNRKKTELFFSFFLQLLCSIFFFKKIKDTNGIPTIIHKNLIKKWKNYPKDFTFDLFVYLSLLFYQKKILRFNIKVAKRFHGISKWNFNIASKLNLIRKYIIFIIYFRFFSTTFLK